MNLSTAVAIIAIAHPTFPAVVSAGKAGKHHTPNTKTAKITKAAKAKAYISYSNSNSISMSYPPPGLGLGPNPNELTCPCFDGEDLMAVTAANVSKDSCTTNSTAPTNLELITTNPLSTHDDSASFGTSETLIYPDTNSTSIPGYELHCTVNDQEKTISSSDFQACNKLIESRCALVKAIACPCFTKEDLMVVTADNVHETSCKIESENNFDILALWGSGFESHYFEFTRDNDPVGLPFGCSAPGETKYFPDANHAKVCLDLIKNRCEVIGKPFEEV